MYDQTPAAQVNTRQPASGLAGTHRKGFLSPNLVPLAYIRLGGGTQRLII